MTTSTPSLERPSTDRTATGGAFAVLIALVVAVVVGLASLLVAQSVNASPLLRVQSAVGTMGNGRPFLRMSAYEYDLSHNHASSSSLSRVATMASADSSGRAGSTPLGGTSPSPISSAVGAESGAQSFAPSSIRLSQSSVNGASGIADSMRVSGWVGDPIDGVQMPDGGLMTIDNTRVIAANEAGIDVQAVVHPYDEPLPPDMVGRFTPPKGGAPSTWGEAVSNRIGAQNAGYRNTYPNGSPFTGWNGS